MVKSCRTLHNDLPPEPTQVSVPLTNIGLVTAKGRAAELPIAASAYLAFEEQRSYLRRSVGYIGSTWCSKRSRGDGQESEERHEFHGGKACLGDNLYFSVSEPCFRRGCVYQRCIRWVDRGIEAHFALSWER